MVRSTTKAERVQMEVLTQFVLDWSREDKEKGTDIERKHCFDRYAPYFRACAEKIEWLRRSGNTKSKGRRKQ